MVDDTSLMKFGKHKGKPMSEVPDEYLQWLSTRDNVFDDMMDYINGRIGKANDDLRQHAQDDSEPLQDRRTPSSCNSCNADILWTKVGGKNHPLDAKALKVCVKFSDGWKFVEGHESHFASCPDADQHRKKEPCGAAVTYGQAMGKLKVHEDSKNMPAPEPETDTGDCPF